MSAAFDYLSSLASPWGYVIVGLLAALEASAFVGLFVPGELAMLVGGYLAYQGRASLSVMIAVAVLGAVVGDSAGYEIGRHFGDHLRRGRLGQRIGAERWARAEAYLRTHGGRAVFFGRFVGVMRALVPALAGASHMPYRRFLAWNALGGVIWAPGLVLLGFAAGRSYRQVAHYAGQASLLLLVVFLVIVAIAAVARWVARHPDELHAFASRVLGRPLPSRLRRRYRSQIDFIARRFRPRSALGLSLTLHLAALAVFGWLFGLVMVDVLVREDLIHVDGPVTKFLVDHRDDWLTTVMRLVNEAGSAPVLAPVILVAGVVAKRRGMGWTPTVVLSGALLGALIIHALLAPLVGRSRPEVPSLVDAASGFSFPSGQATQAMAVLGALAYVVSTKLQGWGARVAAWSVCVVVVLVVGVAPVYLGVHWASDVIGGYALGALWLAALLSTVTTVGGLRHPHEAENTEPEEAPAGRR
ncbi:MAG: bifunctional DedA family/phosphatase PAP2 family protein [Actinomycetota bacterium]|nr:bifunctional DedA family/phosphatase PAP2 family protein [Actinomycetota bacterium]